MSPPTELESGPNFRAWLVNGVTQTFDVKARVAVKSPGLLVIVTDVVLDGEELEATKVPFVHGVD
jgi:hypothetical protein